MAETTASIDRQRALIDDVDRTLIELTGRRRTLVNQLFETKRELGLPLIDPDREARLLAQWRAYAERYEVPPLLAEKLLLILLEDSHTRA